MDIQPKQVAQRLLSRPATESMMLGQWLETELPKAIQFIQNKQQLDSRAARNGLSIAYNLPKMRSELGSAEFEIAFQELLEYTTDLGNLPGDNKLRDHLETLQSCRKKFNDIGDMGTRITDDMLPYLKDIANGQVKEPNPTYLSELFLASGSLSKRLQNETPATLQPMHSQLVYDAFEKDMKQLISHAHKSTGQAMTRHALAPKESHVENVHIKNRIADYWRHR